jgi:hypothetical protein
VDEETEVPLDHRQAVNDEFDERTLGDAEVRSTRVPNGDHLIRGALSW